MKYRYRVGALLFLLAVITYLDRVCISVAGPRIQEYLQIGPQEWGWVVGAFALAYTLFDIPCGWMADRFGPRLVLTRIVLWWSAFTALTGTVSSYPLRPFRIGSTRAMFVIALSGEQTPHRCKARRSSKR